MTQSLHAEGDPRRRGPGPVLGADGPCQGTQAHSTRLPRALCLRMPPSKAMRHACVTEYRHQGIPEGSQWFSNLNAFGVCGGPPGDRTRDTLIKSQVLYH